MISGTQILTRMSDTVSQDDINRRGLLADRLRQVSAKLNDIDRKISKGKSHLVALRDKVEADRLSLVALMQQGRYTQPMTRSVSAHPKSRLEKMQGRVYSQSELAGREGKRFLSDSGMRQAPSQEGKPVKRWTNTVSNLKVLEKAKPFDPRPRPDHDGEFTIPYPPVKP